MNNRSREILSPQNGAAPPSDPPAGPGAMQLLLTPPEAAAALAVSPRTLWSLTSTGQVRAIKVGRLTRYDPRDLRDFVDRLRGQ